jgi:hypothetical protein
MTKKPFQLRMEPHKPTNGKLTMADKLEHLMSPLPLMIIEDLSRRAEPTVEVEDTGLVRRLPVLNETYLNPQPTVTTEDQTGTRNACCPEDVPPRQPLVHQTSSRMGRQNLVRWSLHNPGSMSITLATIAFPVLTSNRLSTKE